MDVVLHVSEGERGSESRSWSEFVIVEETAPLFAASDRGLLFGDGAFVTLRLQTGCVYSLEPHLSNLRQQCDDLGISPPQFLSSPVKVKEAIHALLRAKESKGVCVSPEGSYRVKILVSGGNTHTAGGSGLSVEKRPHGIVLIVLKPHPSPPRDQPRRPLRLLVVPSGRSVVSATPLMDAWLSSVPSSFRLKSLSYIDRLAFRSLAQREGFDDVLTTVDADVDRETKKEKENECDDGGDGASVSPHLSDSVLGGRRLVFPAVGDTSIHNVFWITGRRGGDGRLFPEMGVTPSCGELGLYRGSTIGEVCQTVKSLRGGRYPEGGLEWREGVYSFESILSSLSVDRFLCLFVCNSLNEIIPVEGVAVPRNGTGAGEEKGHEETEERLPDCRLQAGSLSTDFHRLDVDGEFESDFREAYFCVGVEKESLVS
uniref:Aminotransferase class IV n=1 Tax=Chromera velia CCMP2878 TaxID=1169474 RepID=A0A0G4HSW0_9ALVE|mmetsp:Transcript_17357/g.35242  ORF Transcript_17357/g.35242 Transcript_17357/m.35242 type:complete len:428 (-) Transcript_17357:110-1393(-)|eukprot:Cvel_8347.t1-p1 / transcript=Cvel_8347.t1 / gene=Cvel_8347 / organism=Chromera_velia_CCMP2878 / gene_product=hypothetical protein / transcript_product=hypothetical protein / location=Cvel_scaffold459:66275-69141(-) / protein_length=427 / sequence_SO=supercontig / SO=protein_coding / is_pseudo=false